MEKGRCKVSIIIPHYNQTEFLKICLPSITNQTYQEYEVIIIDDCTRNPSVVPLIETLIENHQNVLLVRNEKNMRFIKTVNKGIKLAKGKYVCLLNCDTKVANNFIEKNVEILDSDDSIAGLSCTIVDKYGNNWWSGGAFKAGFPVNLTDDFVGIRPVDFIAGTSAFYRKQVFDEIGLFDESYRMYHEDVEFGLRIRTETNYQVCAFSDKLVIHYGLSSIPGAEISYLGNRNHILMVRKYFPDSVLSVVLQSFAEKAISLVKDILGLHPWLFRFHLVGLVGTLAGLCKCRASEASQFKIRVND